MSDISPSTTTSSTPESHQVPKKVPKPSRRRDKAQLSCTLCRRRKLKCDRNQPCETCSSRGLSASCTYVQLSTHGRIEQNRQTQNSSTSIQARIDQLEGLVVSLMGALNANKGVGPGAEGTTKPRPLKTLSFSDNKTDSEEDKPEKDYLAQLPDTFGRISLENAETSYVGSAHWIAILDGIAELKDHFQDSSSQHKDRTIDTEESEFEGPELLFGRNRYATKQEILEAIPSRRIVDRLVSGYFNAMDLAPVVIHSSTFLKEYEQFWKTPSTTPVMWLGLLFSMMCLATQFQTFSEDETGEARPSFQSPRTPQQLVKKYREKVVQCLILGKYTRSLSYTIETLLLYLTIEHFQCKDTQIGPWILLGIIARIAMRMGYHRDASHSTQISPFRGEMRRRAWATIVHLDLAISSQVGLPRMIKEWQWDTSEPRNLLDEDFDEDMVELPTSRPDTDLTPMLYVVVKDRLLSVFGIVSDLATSTRVSSYAEVMNLDRRLNEARLAIPLGLQPRLMAQSIADNPEIVLKRIYLDVLCYKAECVLHRKYLIPARTNSQYAYSRQTCVKSALQILQHQSTLDEEMRPGGQLYMIRWRLSSLINHDFLLATTILCLDLDRDMVAGSPPQPDVIHALHESYKIWLRSSGSSREAQKAAEALRIVLGKVSRSMNAGAFGYRDQPPQSSPANSTTFEFPQGTGSLLKGLPHYSGASMALIKDQSPTPSSPYALVDSHPLRFEDFGSSTDTQSENEFDWENWDSQFQAQDLRQFLDYGNDLEIFKHLPT